MKSILYIAGGVALVYLVIVIIYALMQRSMIYYPQKIPLEDAQQLATDQGGAPWFGAGGQWLGWQVPAEADPRRRALLFHGNAGQALNRGYFAGLLAGFDDSGPWTVYIHEYPGYGPRDGQPNQKAFVSAALESVDELLEQNPTPLLIIGESIGSGVAAEVARHRPDGIAAMLLVTPFDSMVGLARHHMPFLPVNLLMRDRFDNRTALQHYRGPLAVITAEDDQIVPETFAEPLIAQHQGPVIHSGQSGAGHNTLSFHPEDSGWQAVDRFLHEHLTQSE